MLEVVVVDVVVVVVDVVVVDVVVTGSVVVEVVVVDVVVAAVGSGSTLSTESDGEHPATPTADDTATETAPTRYQRVAIRRRP